MTKMNDGLVFLYCLVHQTMEACIDTGEGHFHRNILLQKCYGEFATCPPPVMTEEQWQLIMKDEEQHGRPST